VFEGLGAGGVIAVACLGHTRDARIFKVFQGQPAGAMEDGFVGGTHIEMGYTRVGASPKCAARSLEADSRFGYTG